MSVVICFFFKQKTAYEMRISDWSSDVCSSDLVIIGSSVAGATLDGNGGDDTIVVNASNTTVIGGAGSDTVSYANAAAAVTVNLQTGEGDGGAAGDTYVDVENVIGTNYGDIIIGGSRDRKSTRLNSSH